MRQGERSGLGATGRWAFFILIDCTGKRLSLPYDKDFSFGNLGGGPGLAGGGLAADCLVWPFWPGGGAESFQNSPSTLFQAIRPCCSPNDAHPDWRLVAVKRFRSWPIAAKTLRFTNQPPPIAGNAQAPGAAADSNDRQSWGGPWQAKSMVGNRLLVPRVAK